MVEEPAKPNVNILPFERNLPESSTVPTFFADGVMNFAPSGEVVKSYFYRLDPDLNNSSEYHIQPIFQIVMPITAILITYLFLENSINNLIKNETITQDKLKELKKKMYPESP